MKYFVLAACLVPMLTACDVLIEDDVNPFTPEARIEANRPAAKHHGHRSEQRNLHHRSEDDRKPVHQHANQHGHSEKSANNVHGHDEEEAPGVPEQAPQAVITPGHNQHGHQ